jgi:hypothetical protein
MHANMIIPTSTAKPPPERMWLVNTGMSRFRSTDRDPADVSAFDHWFAAGRLFLRSQDGMPAEFDARLDMMSPGDLVFAYEDQRGVVAIGRIRHPKDLRNERGPTALYPDERTVIKSLAVDWDTSITRSMRDISSRTKVGGRPLQNIGPGEGLYPIALEMLQEAHARHQVDPDIDEATESIKIQTSSTYGSTTSIQVTRARVGQGAFRAAVLAREPACRMTGITHPDCLVASHIKPWAVCTDDERLDGANGLMLAPHIDHLFDTGRISFSDDGQLMVAPTLNRRILQAWHLDEVANVGPFAADQARYLAHHRLYVFGRSRQRSRRNLVGDVAGTIVDQDRRQLAPDPTPGAE